MITELNKDNIRDINKPNQPFQVFGRLAPTFQDGAWTSTERLFDVPYEKHYPYDEERYEDYIDNPDKTAYLYYHEAECAGQIVLRRYWNRYAFIQDIAVARAHRRQGIGRQLIVRAAEWAREKGLCGLMLETQDVNLAACRFYQKMGFEIGGVDRLLYANFDNADELAIFWYLRFEG